MAIIFCNHPSVKFFYPYLDDFSGYYAILMHIRITLLITSKANIQSQRRKYVIYVVWLLFRKVNLGVTLDVFIKTRKNIRVIFVNSHVVKNVY